MLDPLYMVPNLFLRTVCVLENKADSTHLQRRKFRPKEKYFTKVSPLTNEEMGLMPGWSVFG